jgi:hypothetical protein
VRAHLDALPLAFEANEGQTDPQVKYMARGNGYTAFLTANETVFAMHSSSQANPHTARFQSQAKSKPAAAAIHLKLLGAKAQPEIVAGSKLPSHSNYFIGNDPSKWQSGVKQYAEVSYRDVYPGVNMAFHGQQRQLEFDFIVAPGANAKPIRFGVSGAKHISTDASGNLVISSTAGDVLLHKPVAYQEKNQTREEIASSFVIANNTVTFELGNYDRSRELVIDPSVSYATFLGGTAEDDAYGIAIDGGGNAYVTGQTASINFPTVAGAYSTSHTGGFDVFVSKVSANGSSLLYSTYVGGGADDSGNAIAVDASGSVYVAGGTKSNTDFPVTAGAYQGTYGGGTLDAFVFELASNGGSLTFSTYLGGSQDDVANGIAVDTSGVYVAGNTGSANFPTTVGAWQFAMAGLGNGFITKLNTTGTARVYSTFLGAGGESLNGLAIDSNGNAYVTGAAVTATFVTTTTAFQKTCSSCAGGISDGFVSAIDPTGSSLVYSSFLGGAALDEGVGIAVDSSGDAYVTGVTQSVNFPVVASLQTFGGTQNAFVTEVNPSGTTKIYSTYLGGSGHDFGAAIAVDSNKNAYVTGETNSSDFPMKNATQGALKGAYDAFVSEISASGASLAFSTYLGGTQNENNSGAGNLTGFGGIAVDTAGSNIYVAGGTSSTDFPATAGSKQTAYGGTGDAFVAKISTGTVPANFTITNGALSPTSVNPGGSATATITVTSTNSFSSAVTLACTVSPSVAKGPTCSFSGSPVTPPANSSASATLNVATTAATAHLERPSDRHPSIFYAMMLPVFGIALLGTGMGSSGSRRRKLFGFLMLGMVLSGLLILPACGGSSNNGGGNSGTPAGTYTITVTGSSGGASATGSPAITLTVN